MVKAKNWAIAVGINHYSNLQDLQYAKRDAEAIGDFFGQKEVGFDKVFLFTDDSPPIPADPESIPTQPTYGHLRRFLQAQFEKPLLQPGDNLWFFFAGHGIRHADRDYLMLSDSDPGDVQNTAIPVSYVIERLRRWNSDNVMLFLDACRSEGSREGLGIGSQKYQGVITFYSCRAREKSWEIEELQQGSFTYALLEALQIQGEGNCATVARLDEYLGRRVPQLNQQYGKMLQLPYASAEPATKLHLILLPRYATLQDLAILKNDALHAEVKQDWELAKRLWIRVNMASAGTDWEAIDAIQRLANPKNSTPPRSVSTPSNSRGSESRIISPLNNLTRRRWLQLTGLGGAGVGITLLVKTVLQQLSETIQSSPEASKPTPTQKPETPISTTEFKFEVVTVNNQGKEIKRSNRTAKYFSENLGNNLTLEMVSIPGGKFMMGSPTSEKGSSDDERPQHQVKVQPFFMGKYPVTQAQWKAVANLPKVNRDLNLAPSYFKGDNRPVEQVSWNDAVEFCERLSRKTGKQYRLPSEAEWEYACRAGTTTPFYFGETITRCEVSVPNQLSLQEVGFTSYVQR